MKLLDKKKLQNKFNIEKGLYIKIYMAAAVIALILSSQLVRVFKYALPFRINFEQVYLLEGPIITVKMVFWIALFLSFPLIIYFLFKPIDNKWEEYTKKDLIKVVSIGFGLSLAGVLVALFIILPLLLFVIMGFNYGMANITLNIYDYISFCLSITLINVLLFEMPLIIKMYPKLQFLQWHETENSKKLILFLLGFSIMLYLPIEAFEIALLTLVLYGIYTLFQKIIIKRL